MAFRVALASKASAFRGNTVALKRVNPAVCVASRTSAVTVEAKRICEVTGAKRNKANKVCFSNKKSRTFQEVNLQEKKIFWAAGKRWVKLKLSAQALRTIEKNGIDSVAAKYGVDLAKLKYIDVSPNRVDWLAKQEKRPPMAKNPRRIKNAEKIAASTKTPLISEYCFGKVIMVRSKKA